MSKRALLIGCNYTATPSVTLQGCINDIVNVRNTLIDAYGYQDSNIFMLRDDDSTRLPTRANILSSISNLIYYSTPSDTLWIHYSGHGTQIQEAGSDKPLDDAIVPCDYNKSGFIDDITLFNLIKPAKCTLILCFDSCHSGTACDLEYSINCTNGVLSKVVNNSRFIPDSNIIMLSGCRDAQTSADAYNNLAKQGVGAFTNALLESLRANSHNVDILKLYMDLCAYLQKSGFTQIPVLSSTVPNPAFAFIRATPAPAINALPVKTTTSSNATKVTKELFSSAIGVTSGSESLRGRMQSLIENQ
jgi:metacaspase-1